MLFLRLNAYTGDQRYMDEAGRALLLFHDLIEKQPFAFSHMLEAVDLYQRGPTEIVIVGESASPEFHEWLERLGRLYIPNRALFAVDAGRTDVAFIPEQARGKSQVDGKLTAYVCRERACSMRASTLLDCWSRAFASWILLTAWPVEALREASRARD